MKKNIFTLSLTLSVASLIVFIACSKDVSNSGNTTNPDNIPSNQTVTASLQGRVVDQHGIPIQGAAVTSGTASTTTDVNGVFSFKRISLSSRFGYVQVAKQGFFTGSRCIVTNGGASNYVSIQLVPRTATGTFPASSGGKIAVQTGDTATFGASSVVNANTNAAYTGTVHVYANYLDPTDPNLYKYMPGDLRGIASDGNETALQSFGMIDVEMQDDAGNKLQLAAGQQAILTWAIPTSLQSIAPATIPLWYFNDTTGIWMQQGTAARQGNNYVGTVSHFTFWNCDAPMGTVNFKVRLQDQHGNPLAYTFIEFQTASSGTRGGYTDSTGFAQGLIPKGQTMTLQVLTECGTLIGGINVGPALADQDLGTVTVNITTSTLILTGSVVDCSNNPVDSGYVSILLDGLNYSANVSNGRFILPINRCYNTTTQARLTAGEYSPAQVGSTVVVSADNDSVNVGILSACGNPVRQSIYFSVNGTSFNFVNAPDSDFYVFQPQNIPSNEISGYAEDGSGNSLVIYINQLNGTGVYNNCFFSLNASNAPYVNNSMQVTITQFGPVNGYVTGTIAGTAYDSLTKQNVPITGSLNVIRTQ